MTLGPQVISNALDQAKQTYSEDIVDSIMFLISPASENVSKSLDDFIMGISTRVISTFDSALQAKDTLISELSRELENGRLVRLMAKLGCINERPEYLDNPNWTGENNGQRMLKLFRDYVFHQVDAEGKPVTDLAHILRSLNKLDAGIEEKVVLTTRDEQNVIIVSYKELKKQVAVEFGSLQKQGGKRY